MTDDVGVQARARIYGAVCLETPDAVAGPPEVIALCGRTPWPSIRGNPPVFPKLPYYDVRLWAELSVADDPCRRR